MRAGLWEAKARKREQHSRQVTRVLPGAGRSADDAFAPTLCSAGIMTATTGSRTLNGSANSEGTGPPGSSPGHCGILTDCEPASVPLRQLGDCGSVAELPNGHHPCNAAHGMKMMPPGSDPPASAPLPHHGALRRQRPRGRRAGDEVRQSRWWRMYSKNFQQAEQLSGASLS